MRLEYGKVVLDVIDLLRFDRHAVYTEDGTDLLYWRTVIGVTATYAPGGNPVMPSAAKLSDDTGKMLSGGDNTKAILTARPRGDDPTWPAPVLETYDDYKKARARRLAAPPANALAAVIRKVAQDATPLKEAHSGPETDAELRNQLRLPRQKLRLIATDRQSGTDIIWLESPRGPGDTVSASGKVTSNGMLTDATNGPLPLQYSVIQASGEPHSIAVYFEIQTDLTPCPIGSDRLILSHRFQTTHSYDEHFYLTRTTKGEIVFNGSIVNTFGFDPDSVASQFILPIPLGFQRAVPEITQSSDGLTIRYVVTDTDPTIMFAAGDSGCTHIDIQEKISYTSPLDNTLSVIGSIHERVY